MPKSAHFTSRKLFSQENRFKVSVNFIYFNNQCFSFARPDKPVFEGKP